MPRSVLKNVRVYPPLLLASVVCLFGFVAYAHDDVRAAHSTSTAQFTETWQTINSPTESTSFADLSAQSVALCDTERAAALKRSVGSLLFDISRLILDLDSPDVLEDVAVNANTNIFDFELSLGWRDQVEDSQEGPIEKIDELVVLLQYREPQLQEAIASCPVVEAPEVIIYSLLLDGGWETGESSAKIIISSTEEIMKLGEFLQYRLELQDADPEPFVGASGNANLGFANPQFNEEIESVIAQSGRCPDDAEVGDRYTANYVAFPDQLTLTQSFTLTVTVVCVDSEAYWR